MARRGTKTLSVWEGQGTPEENFPSWVFWVLLVVSDIVPSGWWTCIYLNEIGNEGRGRKTFFKLSSGNNIYVPLGRTSWPRSDQGTWPKAIGDPIKLYFHSRFPGRVIWRGNRMCHWERGTPVRGVGPRDLQYFRLSVIRWMWGWSICNRRNPLENQCLKVEGKRKKRKPWLLKLIEN